MNKIECKKCGKETTNDWGYCAACPSLEELSYIVYADKQEQESFCKALQDEGYDIERVLKWTQEDLFVERWLRGVGLKGGKIQDVFAWVKKWKGNL
jgi:hypothetical protein